jgi:hypothetical protein
MVVAEANQEFTEKIAKLLEFPAPVKLEDTLEQKVAKNPAAVALGKLGGSKGGKARAAKLSPEERTAIAQQAARVRWAKEKAE